MSDEENLPKERNTPSWHSKLKISLVSEAMKNWAAVLMGVAALVTALNSYVAPNTDIISLKTAYDASRTQINELSHEVASLNENVNYLYHIRELEDRKRRAAMELQRSQESIEDNYLENYLTSRFGAKYAKEYMVRRQRLKEEIRGEYNISIVKPRPPSDASRSILPSLEELKAKK